MILTERLTINGEVRDIAGYTLNTPTAGVGESLSIALVEPDLELVPENAVITFETGAGKEVAGEIVYSWKTVLENGRLNGLNYSAAWVAGNDGGFPNDVIEFNTLSPLADRLGLAPELPVTIYDPLRVEASSLIPDATQLIRTLNESGQYVTLTPVLVPRTNLSLYHVLDICYTNRSPLPGLSGGCGYARVITNITDFPVDERIDVTLEGGWHQAALNLYSRYSPDFFEDGDTLYILSPEFGLPPGFVPQELDGLCVIELSRNQETSALANVILLSYAKDSGSGGGSGGELLSIEIIHDEPLESGSGTSYNRTETAREIATYTDINTGELRRIEENWTETRIYAFRPNRIITITPSPDPGGKDIIAVEVTPEAGEIGLISEEHTENHYSGVTKSGYTRNVSALYLDATAPGAPYKFGEVFTEEAVLTWQPDLSHAGEYEQTYSRVYVEGLCLVQTFEIEEDYAPTGQKVKYKQKVYTPILDAVDTGLVTGDGTESLARKPIYTITERLRATGQNQKDIETRPINHLTGGAQIPNLSTRTGSTSTFVPPFSIRYGGGANAGQVRELIKNQESIDAYGQRRAIALDVGRLSPVEGRKIARRRLKLSVNPPRNFEITLPGINFLYRRGFVFIPPLRSGFDRPAIITGLVTSGRGLHTAAAIRDMRIQAREIVNVND